MDIDELDEVQLRSVVEFLSESNPDCLQEAFSRVTTITDPFTVPDIKQSYESLNPKICRRGGKVMTQSEVSDRFVDLMTSSGEKYRKKATSFIRKAIRGETITTVIFGMKETENTIQNDDNYIICGQGAFETYALTNEEFTENYDTNSPTQIKLDLLPYQNLAKKGFKEYRSKRMILAHKVDSEDMKWFRSGMDKAHNKSDSVYFFAPWGEHMLVEEGDILATTYPPDGKGEVYRIEISAFELTYQHED